MPTYGYRCTKCSTEFEAWERMADPPAGRCPACGAKGKRQFFPAGIVFKGSGFYKTDSRSSDGGSAAHRASSASDSKEKAAAETASESGDSGNQPSSAGGTAGDSVAPAPGKTAGKEPAAGSTPAAKPSGDQPRGRPRR
jgi:putative FmdB family regulatory protein